MFYLFLSFCFFFFVSFFFFFFFFFNDTATTEIYTLSLHDALPISHICPPRRASSVPSATRPKPGTRSNAAYDGGIDAGVGSNIALWNLSDTPPSAIHTRAGPGSTTRRGTSLACWPGGSRTRRGSTSRWSTWASTDTPQGI